MSKYDVDLFVIGAGSGGVRAARTAATLGVRVAIAEEKYFGGTCVNVGCVPKKLFVYASQFSENFLAANGYGWQSKAPSFDWTTLVTNKNKEIVRLQGVYERLLQDSGVEIIKERAHLIDAHTVSVGGKTYTTERILIATGGWPYVPDVLGKEFIVTSNEMFYLKMLPKRLLIVGGGYISVEFAGIMYGLGVDVTICERKAKVLKGFDEDVRDFLVEEMTKKGIKFRFNSIIKQIEKVPEGFIVHTEDGNSIATDLVMYATVGLTEAQAQEKYGADIDVYIANFKPMKNTLSGSGERTLMKMIVVKSTDRVVGIHMVGTDAGEIIQGMAIALRAGATKAIFDSTIGIHPTAAEEFVTMRKPVR